MATRAEIGLIAQVIAGCNIDGLCDLHISGKFISDPRCGDLLNELLRMHKEFGVVSLDGLGDKYSDVLSDIAIPGPDDRIARVLANTVVNDYIRREETEIGERLSHGSINAGQAKRLLLELPINGQGIATGADLTKAVIDFASQGTSDIGLRISTGWPVCDAYLDGGLSAGDLYVIGGATSIGKTAMALQLAINVAIKQSVKLLYVSLEMSRRDVICRMISSLTGIPLRRIRLPYLTINEVKEYGKALALIERSGLLLDCSEKIRTIDDIVREVTKAAKQGTRVAVVDYVQILRSSDNGARFEEGMVVPLAQTTLKHLAQELGISVVSVSQLNRKSQATAHENHMDVTALKYAGDTDADVIFLLQRKTREDRVLKVDIAKQRNGSLGGFNLAYLLNNQQLLQIENRG